MGTGASTAPKYALEDPILERKVTQIIKHEELMAIMGDMDTTPGEKIKALKTVVAESIEVWDTMYEHGLKSIEAPAALPQKYIIGFIADNDKLSRVKDETGKVVAFESRLQLATITASLPECSKVKAYSIEMGDLKRIKISDGDDKLRGAELSCAIVHNGLLLSGCDRTGRVLSVHKGEDGMGLRVEERCVCQQHDGDGRGLKIEWGVCKDGCLFMGSHGRFECMPGETCRDRMRHLVKINPDWSTEDLDWCMHYDAICAAIGVVGGDSLEGDGEGHAGYVTHEAALYSEIHKKWFFFPRKVSFEKYDYKTDPYKGGDVFVCYDEEKMKCWTRPMLGKVASKGVADMTFIPGTGDTEILVIRTVENDDGPMESWASIFNIRGDILMQEVEISSDMKFEGIEVLPKSITDEIL